ncbi:inositol monophosphatase family protein [Actinopolymorpha singaporensis]|uniref:Inositol-1-monophosphatase n=1 Tax=Actinopolymorpha singaporensis TaxID=117157 RepID=A0A1H1L1R2_9ACTN|nr:inositol monophosphatase family protein [Actinopolymorpha singaporensis]SDR68528.1 myo-inositol-1(or 4)-monophosphatase [Actinopolymorpha singaporensis]
MAGLDLDELLHVALGAADIARRILRGESGVSLTSVTQKSDRDFASNLDFTVERELRAYLREHTPRFGFLGEEEGSGATEGGRPELPVTDPAADERPFWALDPVDGTSNLIHGVPMCGTSLGLVHRRRPVLGVIDLPFLNERYHARRGGGAFLNGDPIHGGRATSLQRAFVAVGDFATGAAAERQNPLRLAMVEQLAHRVERIRMLGSAATDLAWTAAGRVDACVLLSNKPWDTAAGVIIAREAGADVVDVDGSPHDLDSQGTIAVSAAVRDELLALLAAAGVGH